MDLASSTSLSEVPFCALDFETTQVEGRRGELAIIEIGAQRFTLAGAVGEPFEALVHPDCRIRRFDSNVSGITDAMVRGQPDFVAVSRGFFAYLGGSVIVAHNAPFDRRALESQCARDGIAPPANPFLDTALLFRRLWPSEKHTLSEVAERFKVDRAPTHRAYDDSMVVVDVFRALVGEAASRFSLATYGDLRLLLGAGDDPQSQTSLF